MQVSSLPANLRPLQIFNRYLERGGEEEWVRILEERIGLTTCWLHSSDWVGSKAPSRFTQPFRTIWNPDGIEAVRVANDTANSNLWLLHNVFPVGSAGLYREAKRKAIPIVQYLHNFRPLCVNGYLTQEDLPTLASWPKTYAREIAQGAWQNSRMRTAYMAGVLAFARAAKWFDAIKAWIAVSDFLREQFIRAGVPPERIFSLRHFWRPKALSSKHSTAEHFLYLGRLVEMKGVRVLLAVWKKILREAGPAGPKLVIAGVGPLESVVRAEQTSNSLIHFAGRVSGSFKEELLDRAIAVIAPSLCLESLGLVAYEAYDAAKPILAAHAGGLAEVVSGGQTGLIHQSGDVDQLLEHVFTLSNSLELADAMGRQGREWLEHNASEIKWRTRFSEILRHASRQ